MGDLLEHLNLYFGTEYETVTEFIKGFRQGELAEDYEDDSEKLTHLLMFISSYSRAEKGAN